MNVHTKINKLASSLKIPATDIYQSPTLVYLIDKYNGVYSSNSNIPGASYNPTLNQINLGSPPYNNLTTIAHELGHAI